MFFTHKGKEILSYYDCDWFSANILVRICYFIFFKKRRLFYIYFLVFRLEIFQIMNHYGLEYLESINYTSWWYCTTKPLLGGVQTDFLYILWGQFEFKFMFSVHVSGIYTKCIENWKYIRSPSGVKGLWNPEPFFCIFIIYLHHGEFHHFSINK